MANHNQVIVELAKRYPKCFVAEKWIKHHPISTSVHVELVVEGITLPENELATILRRYVRRIEYLKAMKPGAVRLNLRGERAGMVSDAVQSDDNM